MRVPIKLSSIRFNRIQMPRIQVPSVKIRIDPAYKRLVFLLGGIFFAVFIGVFLLGILASENGTDRMRAAIFSHASGPALIYHNATGQAFVGQYKLNHVGSRALHPLALPPGLSMRVSPFFEGQHMVNDFPGSCLPIARVINSSGEASLWSPAGAAPQSDEPAVRIIQNAFRAYPSRIYNEDISAALPMNTDATLWLACFDGQIDGMRPADHPGIIGSILDRDLGHGSRLTGLAAKK
jgi:hypothetical protein